MLVPVGLWRSGDWWGLFSFFFVALLLLGCDEVATQLEVGGEQRRARRLVHRPAAGTLRLHAPASSLPWLQR